MAKQRAGLQSNPFDSVIPDLRSDQTSQSNQDHKGVHGVKGTPKTSSKRQRFTAHVETELVERAKNAVYWTPGLTMALLVEKGLELVLKKMEKENDGAFIQRASDNPGGRPLS